ncbi:MAG TPA: hypothetical protein VM600_07070, partial [Actinomycetota bacterium]|nr:hypothetical protein [Actinomycetota bacterium]
MLKQPRIGTRSRVLIAAVVTLLAALTVLPAVADTPPATAHVQTGGDNYLNGAEVGAVSVTGSWDYSLSPAINRIQVRLVNSAACSAGASQTTGNLNATLNGDGSWSAGPFDVSAFSEGAAVCARVLVSDNGGTSWFYQTTSDNLPVKDTTITAGTTQILDPNGDGFMNAAEATAGISASYARASNDSVAAQSKFVENGGATPTGCGPFPVDGISGEPSRTVALTPTCAAAMAQGPFTFNATWKDAAGNVSTETVSTSLIKDTIAPTISAIAITTDPVIVSNRSNVVVEFTAEAGSNVVVTLRDASLNTETRTRAATGGLDTVIFDATELNDGTLTARGVPTDAAGNTGSALTDTAFKDATPPPAPIITITPDEITEPSQSFVTVTVKGELNSTINLTLDDEDPGTPAITRSAPMSHAQTIFEVDLASLTDGLITATATLTDGVGNVSLPGLATAAKRFTPTSVVMTAPAPGSLHQGTVRIAGTATPGTVVEIFEAPSPQVIASATANASGVWQTSVTYTRSGVHTIFARAQGATKGSAQRTFDVDPIKPTSAITTPNMTIFQGGETVLLEGTATDDFSGLWAVEVNVFDSRGVEVNPTTNPPRVVVGKTVVEQNATCTPACPGTARSVRWRFDATTLSSGMYTIQVWGID